MSSSNASNSVESSAKTDPPSQEMHAPEHQGNFIARMTGNMLAPLRYRNYSLLLSGQLISTIGDLLCGVAMPWFMLSTGGGAQALGIVLTAYGIPRAAGVIFGGALSDRWQPRRVMLSMDMARTFLMGLLAMLVAQGHPVLWSLCLVSAFLGLSGGIFSPPSISVLPALLPDKDLQAGNALQTTSSQLAGIVGSGFAGIVVGWLQPAGAFAIDAATFVVSAAALAMMSDALPLPVHDVSTEQNGGQIEVPQTFWQLLRTSRFMRFILVIVFCVNFGSGATFEVALPAFAHDQLQSGASGYGFMLAGFAAGAIVGAVFAAGMGRLKRPWLVCLLLFLAMAGFSTLIPFLNSVIAVTGVLVVCGVLNSVGNILAITIIQQVFPRHLMGRVMSAIVFGNVGLYPFSVALGGFVVAHYGSLPIFLANGLLFGATCLIGALQKEFWSVQ